MRLIGAGDPQRATAEDLRHLTSDICRLPPHLFIPKSAIQNPKFSTLPSVLRPLSSDLYPDIRHLPSDLYLLLDPSTPWLLGSLNPVYIVILVRHQVPRLRWSDMLRSIVAEWERYLNRLGR